MELNDQNFEQEVLKYTEGPVLVDFYAPWCGSCKVQGPILDTLTEELKDGQARIFKVNVEVAPSIAEKYEIMSLPTLIIFRNGEVKETLIGLNNAGVLKEKLAKYQ
ncbi:MAG: Thioredoxin [Parcubacteria group bacterium GW2011_GWC2_39_14]|nr:MAG: Thioredoxin [Parcubacteria group bacterium GW2011_GWC2_39_14]KKR53398.1 MAG: Thioredoxin [Parcubacteria group bacterium GW2011_GWA2_40_23]